MCARARARAHLHVYVVGKAIDNSQPCVRGSRKCETMFVNNWRANSWEPRLCGKPEAKWSGGRQPIYIRFVPSRAPIRINIPFEFDTIFIPRDERSRGTLQCVNNPREIGLHLSHSINDDDRDNAISVWRLKRTGLKSDSIAISRRIVERCPTREASWDLPAWIGKVKWARLIVSHQHTYFSQRRWLTMGNGGQRSSMDVWSAFLSFPTRNYGTKLSFATALTSSSPFVSYSVSQCRLRF